MTGKIRVLIMASSSVFAARLAAELRDPLIEVAGTVFTVSDMLRNIQRNTTNVLLMDTRQIAADVRGLLRQLQQYDRNLAIILLCAANDMNIAQYRTMASDVARLPLQDSPIAHQAFIKDIILKIKLQKSAGAVLAARPAVSPAYAWRPGQPFSTRFTGIIAIGASAGGTEATQEVLKDLPPNMPGIVVTQHMPPVFTNVYAQRLDNICKLRVREAKDHMTVEPGTVLIAPGGLQMRVQKIATQKDPIVRCYGEERVSGHCPSVDVMFDSVAKAMGRSAIGIILTGMGSDGANGLLAMRRGGCHTFGQDEQTSMVYGMPQVAFQKGAVETQLPLGQIGPALVSKLMTLKD